MNLVRAILGGVPEISPVSYEKRYGNKEHLIVDLRNSNMFDGGHIDGAINIPFSKLDKKLKALPKNQPIVCVCQDGTRGREATDMLLKAGYSVTNLAGGMQAWRKHSRSAR